VTRRYAGRVVMITGAARGLGLAMAERFAGEGARLAICDTSGAIKDTAAALADRAAANEAADQAAGKPTDEAANEAAEIVPSVVDVTDAEQVNQWTADTIGTFSHVDVLVNNAGVIRDNRLERMTDDEWDAVMAASLGGMFHCCRAVFAHMKDRRYGRILSFSSMSWRGNFGQANYAAAKAGIVGMARTIALEGAAHGITSNVIAPGLIDTPMLASMNAAARAKLAARVPLGRIGDPADIAEAAAFLCSKRAAYVTGVVLDVDGGISIGSALR
jgi:NAD(P)-dependent dehydrogenase (short-subunit alcohol dehydrogenase family)